MKLYEVLVTMRFVQCSIFIFRSDKKQLQYKPTRNTSELGTDLIKTVPEKIQLETTVIKIIPTAYNHANIYVTYHPSMRKFG